MKTVIAMVLFWFLLVPWIFLNYGRWIDVTQEPIKSDMIVCLGGGTKERLKRATALYRQGYSRKKSIILLGESYDTRVSLQKQYPFVQVEQHHQPHNTKEEIVYIKHYMIQHGYKTALVVTDPPHSRRVALLNTVLHIEGDDALTLHIVSSHVHWWNAGVYYTNQRAGEMVFSETLKILYTLWCYAIFQKLGAACE